MPKNTTYEGWSPRRWWSAGFWSRRFHAHHVETTSLYQGVFYQGVLFVPTSPQRRSLYVEGHSPTPQPPESLLVPGALHEDCRLA